MSDESRLSELLHRWQDSHARGESLPLDELCRDCPELRSQVEGCIEAIRQLSVKVGMPWPETRQPIGSSDRVPATFYPRSMVDQALQRRR